METHDQVQGNEKHDSLAHLKDEKTGKYDLKLHSKLKETHNNPQPQWWVNVLNMLEESGSSIYRKSSPAEIGDLKDFFLQTLQHLHDEIMEKKQEKIVHFFGEAFEYKEIVTVEDLQAIFTRYGVKTNK